MDQVVLGCFGDALVVVVSPAACTDPNPVCSRGEGDQYGFVHFGPGG